MKIRCKLHREGGTKVKLGAIEYHFKADKDGEHVADVTDQKHIQVFLNIPEAYCRKGEAELEPVVDPLADELAEAFPLADADVDAMDNRTLIATAKKELGLTGGSKAVLDNYAREKLGIESLSDSRPKASYADLLRFVLTEVQKAQRAEKQEALLDDLATHPGDA